MRVGLNVPVQLYSMCLEFGHLLPARQKPAGAGGGRVTTACRNRNNVCYNLGMESGDVWLVSRPATDGREQSG